MWRNGPKTLAKPTYFYQLKIVIEFSSADDIKKSFMRPQHRYRISRWQEKVSQKQFVLGSQYLCNKCRDSEVGIYEKEHV